MSKVRGLFITGTDTEVGKTYVTAMIARELCETGHSVGVYKPAASGCYEESGSLISGDAMALWEAAGKPGELEFVCPQLFKAPLAPHLAAWAEGRQIDERLLVSGIDYWVDRSDIVLVEGVGGLMSPVSDDLYVADLAEEFGFPLIVVTKNVLGTINQTLQTLITASTFRDGLTHQHGTSQNSVPLLRRSSAGGDSRHCLPKRQAVAHRGETSGLDTAGIVLNQVAPIQNDDPSVTSNRRELVDRCVPPLLAGVPWQASRFDVDVDWFELAR